MLINQKKIYDYSVELEQIILKKKYSGEQNIIVKQINIKTNRFIHYQALFNEEMDRRNQGVARYYDIKSIKAIK